MFLEAKEDCEDWRVLLLRKTVESWGEVFVWLENGMHQGFPECVDAGMEAGRVIRFRLWWTEGEQDYFFEQGYVGELDNDDGTNGKMFDALFENERALVLLVRCNRSRVSPVGRPGGL